MPKAWCWRNATSAQSSECQREEIKKAWVNGGSNYDLSKYTQYVRSYLLTYLRNWACLVLWQRFHATGWAAEKASRLLNFSLQNPRNQAANWQTCIYLENGC